MALGNVLASGWYLSRLDKVMTEGWFKVLKKIVAGFFLVGVTILLAALVAPTINKLLALSPSQLKWARLVALGMVAWGVLGRSGWEIQSWKGQSPPEKFNVYWFKALYVLGLFCGALGLLLESVGDK